MNRLVLALVLLITAPGATAAQSPWVPPSEGGQIVIELLKPHFQSPNVSGEVLSLSVRWPLAGGWHLVGEVPPPGRSSSSSG